MPEDLRDALDQYDAATLQTILNFQGYKVEGRGRLSKTELVRALQTVLTDPSRVLRTCNGLSRAEREVLVALQRQGGTATRGAIRRRLRDLDLLDARETRLDTYSSQQPDYRRTDSRFMDEILAHLLVSGLVFGRRSPDPWGRMDQLTFRMSMQYSIPAPILGLLPPPPELPANLPDLGAPQRILESSARTFQRDLYLYWSYVYHNRPELIGKGLLAKRHLTAINETLLQRETIGTGQGETDFPRLLFMRILLIQLGLVQVKNMVLEAKAGEAFFGASPLDRIRQTFEAYVNGRQLNELALLLTITSMGEPLLPVPDRMIDARRVIALHFKLATGWTGLDGLISRVRETQYEFFLPRIYRPELTPSYYYPTVHPYTQLGNPLGWEWAFTPGLDEGEGWRRVEGQWISWMVTGPFYWMGLVNLGFQDSRMTEPDCFLLSAPGCWLLAAGAAPEIPQEGGQVIVQPDFTLLAFDPISDAVLFRLEQFAQRVSAERAILFRMTQQSVYAGQQAGWEAPRIQSYLEELSGQPLPGNVARTLNEWQSTHERIHIYPHVNVMLAQQAADLDVLSKEKKLAGLLKERLAPEVVVLPRATKLRDAFRILAEQGWRAVVTPQDAGLPPRSVSVDAQGRLLFLERNPGLYLRAHLARFAEAQGEYYRLSADSVRRAARAGMTAGQIIAGLNQVLDQPLNPALEQRVLAWSGHYGQVQAEEVTLLRFKNETALTDLLRDPEFSRLLRTFRPMDLKQIAVARAKDIEKLRQMLDERGVDWIE